MLANEVPSVTHCVLSCGWARQEANEDGFSCRRLRCLVEQEGSRDFSMSPLCEVVTKYHCGKTSAGGASLPRHCSRWPSQPLHQVRAIQRTLTPQGCALCILEAEKERASSFGGVCMREFLQLWFVKLFVFTPSPIGA